MASGKPTFIDVFAGCGGLSLGLMQSGWQGLFAVEKDSQAFSTLAFNLIQKKSPIGYSWPCWLPEQAVSITTLLNTYRKELSELTVDMVVGGPPCQGFSSAGRRREGDPRNQLTRQYLRLVRIVRPKIVLLENVRGFTVAFSEPDGQKASTNYAQKISTALEKDYNVYSRIVDVSEFGVPQRRKRFFLIGIRKDCAMSNGLDPFDSLFAQRKGFLALRKITARTTARSAISDLECGRNPLVSCPDSAGFTAVSYGSPRTKFQKLMQVASPSTLQDTRLAKHRPHIVARFKKIIEECHSTGRLATSLSSKQKSNYGLKKAALRVLDPNAPAPTITSLPDDLLHYSEPRTLTVRENARLQTFPDWFEFKGKYTTGGERRAREVPRFTQVANAVPPLMAEALGKMLASLPLTAA